MGGDIMRKTIIGFAIAIFSISTMAVFAAAPLPVAAVDNNLLWGNEFNQNAVQGELGLGNRDPRAIVASVVRIILGFLGIVAVIIILLGGFKWMTAGGNEEKVGEARKLIVQGIIGLVIILAAFGIATFVINSLLTATTVNSN